MGKIDLDGQLFLKHLQGFTPGVCFLCVSACDPTAILHAKCAEIYFEEKNKRIKAAWEKAHAEYNEIQEKKSNG